MPTTDLSTEALLVRREIAEKATPGPWGVKCERHDNTCHEYLILTEDGDKIVGADKIDLREVYYRSLPEAICSLDSHDATHIAANSPDVVIATIDELLRLREQNERLAGIQEMASAMLNAVISDSTGEDEKIYRLGITCPHCDMHFSTVDEAVAHDAACPNHPASIRAERLEKEADWLATAAANAGWYGRRVSPEDWREAARKAVEEEQCPKN